MKINGRELSGPRIEVLVIPRQEGDLIFQAQSVLDYEPFDTLYPQPKPPVRMLPGGIKSLNTESPKYQEELDKWSTLKWHWMVLKSLEATEGLEWDTVDMQKPETYENYRDDMKNAGMSPAEIAMLISLVTDACGLNQTKVEEATKAFLAGRGKVQENASSPDSEPSSTPSGEPASVSA